MAAADTVAVELANVADSKAIAEEYARLAQSPGLPKLSARIAPALRPALAQLLKRAEVDEASFAQTETWSVALSLARAGQGSSDKTNGIDRAVLNLTKGKPVVELEGARGQLSLFDALPEKEQRDLLEAVVRDGGRDRSDSEALTNAWRKGDFVLIEAETRSGFLADPELREALFTGRNRAWSEKIAALLAQRKRVFVAVGAAHMAGTDGLPAMLAGRGFSVRRVQ
jgi:uncharacterized protein